MADDFEAVAAAVAVASGHSLLTFMLQIVFAPLSLSLFTKESKNLFCGSKDSTQHRHHAPAVISWWPCHLQRTNVMLQFRKATFSSTFYFVFQILQLTAPFFTSRPLAILKFITSCFENENTKLFWGSLLVSSRIQNF